MCNNTQLIIANGVKRWPNSQAYTCHTTTGKSVIDYLLISERATERVQGFYIKALQPESDHCPLHVHLKWDAKAEKPAERRQKPTKRVFDYKKAPSYATMVEASLRNQPNKTWETFQRVIKECTEECFPTKSTNNGKGRSTFPNNRWFDKDCREARQQVKEAHQRGDKAAWLDTKKSMRTTLRRKKRQFELQRAKDLARKKAENPGGFWEDIKRKPYNEVEDITLETMLEHCRSLYSKEGEQQMPSPSQPTMPSTLFSREDIDLGLKKLTNRKVVDLQETKAEMLKWAGDEATTWIQDLFNKAIETGMPEEWTQNWIKPIHKAGDRSVANNYRTIMVGSTMAKLFGTVMENKISSWAEENSKRAKSQAGFRKHYNTTDHLVTLRVMMEESRLRGEGLYCCFVDFKKPLHIKETK